MDKIFAKLKLRIRSRRSKDCSEPPSVAPPSLQTLSLDENIFNNGLNSGTQDGGKYKIKYTPVSNQSMLSNTYTRDEERAEEVRGRNFTRRTIPVGLEIMVERLGMNSSFQERKTKVLRTSAITQIRKGLEQDFINESKTRKAIDDELDLAIKLWKEGANDGKLKVAPRIKEPSPLHRTNWLSKLSIMAAFPSEKSNSTFVTAPNQFHSTDDGFKKLRKPDSILRSSASRASHAQGILSTFEFTTREFTSPAPGRLLNAKIFQQVAVLRTLLQVQSHRNFTLGINIAKDTGYILLLDRECLQVATISKCWSTDDGFASLAAVVRGIEISPISFLGFPIWWEYDSNLRPIAFDSDSIPSPLSFNYPDGSSPPSYLSVKLPLNVEPLHSPSSHAFQRATTVLEQDTSVACRHGYSVCSTRWVNSEAPYRTTENFERLGASLSLSLPRIPTALITDSIHKFLPTLTFSAVFEPLLHQISDQELEDSNEAAERSGRSARIIRRHLELDITSTRVKAIHVNHRTPYLRILYVIHSAVKTLGHFQEKRFLHRDFSVNNVMLMEEKGKIFALVIDVDCGTSTEDQDEANRQEQLGTFSTMALEPLLGESSFTHLFRHELESIDLLLIFLILQKIKSAKPRLSGAASNIGKLWNAKEFEEAADELGAGEITTKDAAIAARRNLYDAIKINDLLSLLEVFPDSEDFICFMEKLSNFRIAKLGRFNAPRSFAEFPSRAERQDALKADLIAYNSVSRFKVNRLEYLKIICDEIERVENGDTFIETLDSVEH